MRIKLFFFLALPFLMFAGEVPLNLTAGSEYVYEYSYMGKTSKVTFTVLGIDEKGCAKVAHKHQGDWFPWLPIKEYNFFIDQNRWISITDEPYYCFKLCSGNIRFLIRGTEIFFKPYTGYRNFTCSEELDECEQRFVLQKEAGCLESANRIEIVIDRKDGMLLSCRAFDDEEQYLEISRQDQSN